MQLPTSVTAVALSAVHLGLALGVTSHALATKRDPASAVGWIGLAWLSPIVGSVLYLLLGINRVRRRARSLRDSSPAVEVMDGGGRTAGRSEYLEPLSRAGSRITGRPIEADNS